MAVTTGLSESLENYLEAIYHVVREKKAAKARDIANRLNVKSSSVTGALQALAAKGLINYAPYDLITLTDTGLVEAGKVARRHQVLRDFLTKVLGVDYKEADQAACRMEHTVQGDILERFTQFVEFVERCPRSGGKWLEGFGYHCDRAVDYENCQRCIQLCLDEAKDKARQESQSGSASG
jgi:DtxR family Mn-dependent transcriptional regulator